MPDIFVFRWQVATGGYQWIQTQAAPGMEGARAAGLFLTAITPPVTARLYVPLPQYPALFRTFIETPPTPEGIQAFANQYGLLGEPVITSIQLPNTPRIVGGELLGRWQAALATLKQAVTLWDLVQADDVERLAAHIIWTGDTQVDYRGPLWRSDETAPPENVAWTPHALIASAQFQPERLEHFQPGDVGQPALYYVQQVVNTALEGQVSPRLLWNEERTALGLYIFPHSLIGALWLQFARAISGNKSYHRCEYCGKWFEVSLEASRPTRVYCSDACRFKAYRKRQEDAYQLHQQGVPLKEIAKRLGTDTTTAKGWIKKRKEV